MKIKNLTNKIIDFIENHSLIFILAGFVLTNILFNYRGHLSELWHDRSLEGAVAGEIQANELGADIIYQRIKNLENPYKPFDKYLFPIGIDTAGASIGFVFWMFLFRPFLSVHQAFSMIVILNFFLTNLGMYFLLRVMKIRKMISFLVALMFGYMTFITPRIGGHLEFTTHYFLPWFYWVILIFLQSKDKWLKIIMAFLAGFLQAMSLYHNIYYFLILNISLGVLCFYFVITKYKNFYIQIWKNKYYLLLSFLVATLTLYPWIKGILNTMLFSLPPQPMGWVGAIEFSSDLFGFFVPSIYNNYYGEAAAAISSRIPFAKGIFENFSYPGLIIIFSFILIVISLVQKKLGSIKNRILPYLITSLSFALLSMGPFLHILGQWFWQVDKNIRLVIPLPFIVFHYLPFLNNIRVPGRLTVGFIFFGYIVVAILLNEILKNKSKRIIMFSFLALLGIFIIDHRYRHSSFGLPRNIPHKIYQTIASDKDDLATVMKIPFVVRDGLMYFGSVNHILVNEGQGVHRKSIIGGYAGRLPIHAFDYYQNNPFLGYMGLIFDKGFQTNGYLIMRDANQLKTFDLELSQKAINFLNLKYVILEKPTPNISTPIYDAYQKLELLGFSEVLEDSDYLLLSRELNSDEFLAVNFENPDDVIMLALGWEGKEIDYRWSNKRSSVMFNLKQEREMMLEFEAASFYQEQKVKIYLNKDYVGELNLSTDNENYEIKLPKLKRGVNTIHFVFDQSFEPKNVLAGSLDERELSAKFYHVTLKDGNDN